MKLLTAGPRPASVYFRGGEVMIYIHDLYYSTMRRRILADLAAFHPDSGSRRRRRVMDRPRTQATQFKVVLDHYQVWLREQRQWYAAFGLLPPKHRAQADVAIPQFVYKPRKDAEGYVINSIYRSPLNTQRMRAQAAGAH